MSLRTPLGILDNILLNLDLNLNLNLPDRREGP